MRAPSRLNGSRQRAEDAPGHPEREPMTQDGPNIHETIERNIAMELVRVTEAAAMSAARYMGRGDKNLVDREAVTAMRYVLGHVAMDGIVPMALELTDVLRRAVNDHEGYFFRGKLFDQRLHDRVVPADDHVIPHTVGLCNLFG